MKYFRFWGKAIRPCIVVWVNGSLHFFCESMKILETPTAFFGMCKLFLECKILTCYQCVISFFLLIIFWLYSSCIYL
jgi:hypothetical protein